MISRVLSYQTFQFSALLEYFIDPNISKTVKISKKTCIPLLIVQKVITLIYIGSVFYGHRISN